MLAHPLTMNITFDEIERFADELAEAGLKGIEGYHGDWTLEEQEPLRDYADRKGLIASGGSDYHGDMRPDRTLPGGKSGVTVPPEVLDQLKAAAEELNELAMFVTRVGRHDKADLKEFIEARRGGEVDISEGTAMIAREGSIVGCIRLIEVESGTLVYDDVLVAEGRDEAVAKQLIQAAMNNQGWDDLHRRSRPPRPTCYSSFGFAPIDRRRGARARSRVLELPPGAERDPGPPQSPLANPTRRADLVPARLDPPCASLSATM